MEKLITGNRNRKTKQAFAVVIKIRFAMVFN